VARTPRETEEPKPLPFELLRDFGNRVAEAYGLVFTLPNPSAQSVRLADLVARGPVVLSFYRGRW